MRSTFFLILLLGLMFSVNAQESKSVARIWNEILLEGIRNDFARPTVHARNLFHVSAAMYDAWAVFSLNNETYLLGKSQHGFSSEFNGFTPVGGMETAREVAISYAAYRMIEHRFSLSPGVDRIMEEADSVLVDVLKLDNTFTSTDYSTGSAAALGNYIAEQYINYGLQDGSNESGQYENLYYETVNDPINLKNPGNPDIINPNRWQPIAFDVFIDQSGNEIPGKIPPFLSPEWGWVLPFSLTEEEKTIKERDGDEYVVYHDPGPPPMIDTENGGAMTEQYQWTFSMVAVWSGHLDANLDATLDISPASLGNFDLNDLPSGFGDYNTFYDYTGGGDPSEGHDLNPVTEEPYEPQVVKLGDYARILAEFWADGPDSETPPGHWFTILNYVNDHPDLERKFEGVGEELDPLEWDVKAYFILGGAMHDVAITAWGIKGFYDYVRPVSAIRYMADLGQSTDSQLPSYHIAGIPLVDGYIELVGAEDPLVGASQEHLNKIKLKAWKGPDFIQDPETDVAGVGWILAENWWPYQRPTFITPPFAGFVSGHSTYSRAAAEVMTRITGTRFFPGGMGVFEAPMNEFLVFEDGPSQDITLEWATYQDASDQCSLSRIWGGIHPPADDLLGRVIGEEIGNEAFEYALNLFSATPLSSPLQNLNVSIYPNPTADRLNIEYTREPIQQISLYDMTGKKLSEVDATGNQFQFDISQFPEGRYILTVRTKTFSTSKIILKR